MVHIHIINPECIDCQISDGVTNRYLAAYLGFLDNVKGTNSSTAPTEGRDLRFRKKVSHLMEESV